MGDILYKNSAALVGTDDFDIVAGGQARRRPFRPPHHRAVDGDGEEAGGGVDAAVGQQLGDRRRRAFLGDAVDAQPDHCATAGASRRRVCAAAKRSGPNGRATSGTRPFKTKSAMTPALTGVSRMPLRWWPVATTRPSMPLGPRIGASSREPGRKPTQVSAIANSSIAGTARHAPSNSA